MSVADFVADRWRRHRPRTALEWIELLTGLVCAAGLLYALGYVFRPIFVDPTTYGSHDWDQMETHRYLVVKTILRFHQFPFWNPYACGGHPAWGGFESDPTVVSPWLPAYLLAPFPLALRIEIVGTTLLGAVGAWLLASRFTRSRALRALVAVLFVLNGRWVLQISVGHVWHTVYAWTPWVLYFFDCASYRRPGSTRSAKANVVLAAACLAMTVYMGGIYPLPQTAVMLIVYALLLAFAIRSFVPLVQMVACGAIAVGLAAPRLLPIFEVLRRFPRLIDSPETMDLTTFLATLTSRQEVPVSFWGWHEWGMYIGWGAFLAIVLGVLLARGLRERALRVTGLAILTLAFGRFSDYAPWPLLHLLPVFSSQHVPSRWMLPALLVLACVAAATAERLLRRTGRSRPLIEIAAVAGVAFLVADVCAMARPPMTHTFGRRAPAIGDSVGPFRTEMHVPAAIDYDPGEWAPTTLAVEIANIGSLDCNTFPGFNNYTRDHLTGRSPGLGAHAVGQPDYHGEAYVAEGGTARIVSFSPNEIEVQVDGTAAGAHVVLNQNWDPGWTANGEPTISWHDTVAGVVHAPSERVTFRYRPKTLWLGLLVFAVTVGLIARGRRLLESLRARWLARRARAV